MIKTLITHVGLGYALTIIAFFILVLKLGYPNHRVIAVTLWLISLVPFVLSILKKHAWIKSHADVTVGFLTAYWPQVLLGALLILVIYLVWIFVPFHTTDIKRLSSEERQQYFTQDTDAALYLADQLSTSLDSIESVTTASPASDTFSSTERAELQQSWELFVHTMFELDVLKHRYKAYIQLDPIAEADDHQTAFILAYSSLVQQYTAVLKLDSLISEQPEAVKMFNEARANDGIAAHTWDTLQMQLTSPETLIKLNTGRLYLEHVTPADEQSSLATDTKERLGLVDASLMSYPKRFAKNPLNILERELFSLWFPVQKNIAVQMSHIRATDRDYFITPEQLASQRSKLQPGDILLERRNWHITNVGIPGFWPHAALYVGTVEEMDAHFDGFAALGGVSMSDYLQKEFPETYASFVEAHADGFPHAVIEAKRPGVILNSLEESANADALAVLRLRADKQAQFDAVVYAFSQVGKPYDFDFDFATDNSMVCSELVYKAYKQSPLFPPQRTLNGRQIISPNDLAELFSKQYNSNTQHFDLILFLDSDESTGKAVEKDVDAFLPTWERPKWYLLTQ